MCPPQAPPRKGVCAYCECVLATGATLRGYVCSPEVPPCEGVCARRRRCSARVCVFSSPQALLRKGVYSRRSRRLARVCMLAAGATL